jgi:hypothetical protein
MTRRPWKRDRCPLCGRIVAHGVPARGDGRTTRWRRHRRDGGDDLAGSGGALCPASGGLASANGRLVAEPRLPPQPERRCARCRRVLRSPDSIASGLGRGCERAHEIELRERQTTLA